jgi:branched-chain amino acid transport system ATP-binding protein
LLLEADHLEIGYEKKQVIYNVSIRVEAGEFVALIGHNGAGKTTLLKTLCGYLKPYRGRVIYKGEDITAKSPAVNVKKGICFVHQEKSLFPNLSVLENLELACHAVGKSSDLRERLQDVYRLFPILEQREKQRAETLSGGQQKQLSVAMAMLVRPDLLLLDEPSLGLSPSIVTEMGKVLKKIQAMGTAIILVEQNVKLAISLSQRIYVMRTGKIILDDSHENMEKRTSLWDLF